MNLATPLVRGRRRRRRVRRTLKGVLLSGAAVLIIVGGGILLMAKPAADVYYSSLSARDEMLKALDAVKQQQISVAAMQVRLAHDDFIRANRSMNALLPLRAIPYVGRQLKAAHQMILAGIEITSGLEEALDAVEKIVVPVSKNPAAVFADVTPEQKRAMLQALRESGPQLERASTHLALAEKQLEKAPTTALVAQVGDAVKQANEQVPTVSALMDTLALAARVVPQLAGYPEAQEYLILFQNNTELRPAGGFIGSYGRLQMKDGGIVRLETDDIYNLDRAAKINVPPPWQIKRLANPYMTTWLLRDSNWSPDFPTSAENALHFYQIEGGEGEFAGVFSITPTFLEEMLSVIGPVKIPGEGEAFTSENVISRIQFETELNFDSVETRKGIIGQLAKSVLQQTYQLPRDKWIAFAEVLRTAFAEKNVMIYLRDQDAQTILENQGWTGTVNQDLDTDSLMVVDANMASLKTDPFVTRGVTYQVDFSQPRPRATVTLTYKNAAPGFTYKTTRYRTWVRVYAPEGSNLVSIEGQDTAAEFYDDPSKSYEISQELSKTAFGTFVVTEIGEERTVTVTYDLPERIGKTAKNGTYALRVQKQPGVIETHLNIDFVGLKNEALLRGEGELVDATKPEGPRKLLLRRDAIWSLPKSSLEPSKPFRKIF